MREGDYRISHIIGTSFCLLKNDTTPVKTENRVAISTVILRRAWSQTSSNPRIKFLQSKLEFVQNKLFPFICNFVIAV